MKISNVGSESCSLSIRDGFVMCAIFTIVLSLWKSFAYYHNTVMTGGSLGIAFGASSLRFQTSFSVISCRSVVSKKTASSCAMPVDSVFTSIGFVGMSSLIFRIFFIGIYF